MAFCDSTWTCVLFSSPCAMKLEKRMSNPNVHLTIDDILLAPFMTMPGAHAPVCEESVSSILASAS